MNDADPSVRDRPDHAHAHAHASTMRLWLTLGGVFALLLVGMLVLLMRLAPPSLDRRGPKTDFLALHNADTLATPATQRAWPVYQDISARYDFDVETVYVQAEAPWSLCPRDDCWPEARAMVNRNAALVAEALRGAALPAMGFPYWLAPPDPSASPIEQAQSQLLMNTTLESLGTSRSVARLVELHIYASAEDGDAAAVRRGLHALSGIARQVGQGEFVVEQLVALSILALRNEAVSTVIQLYPDLFTPAEYADLAERIAGEAVVRPDLGLEAKARPGLTNLLEWTFTDDGHGDGAATEAYLALSEASAFRGDWVDAINEAPEPVARAVLRPAKWWACRQFAGRQAQMEKLEQWLALARAERSIPLRNQPTSRLVAEIERAGLAFEPAAMWMSSAESLGRTRTRWAARQESMLAVLRWHAAGRPGGDPASAVSPWPEDPMDGRPMRWKRDDAAGGLLLYSIGDDLDDDGGQSPATGLEPRFAFEDPRFAEDGDWVVFPQPLGEPVPAVAKRGTVEGWGMGMGGFVGMGDWGLEHRGAEAGDEEASDDQAAEAPEPTRVDCGHAACRAFYDIKIPPETPETPEAPDAP